MHGLGSAVTGELFTELAVQHLVSSSVSHLRKCHKFPCILGRNRDVKLYRNPCSSTNMRRHRPGLTRMQKTFEGRQLSGEHRG
jgi:hypothetical protein